MNLFRHDTFKKWISYSVISSMIGLHIIPLANAASMDEIMAAERQKNAEALEKAKAGDYSGIKGSAIGGVSSIKEDRLNYVPPEEYEGLHGSEDDRSFNSSHTNSDGSHESIKSSGQLFKVEMENNPDAAESKAYDTLNGVYTNPEYHTRNRDYKEFGDKLTLVDDENSGLLEEYNRLSAEAENGTMCRIEIVTEAVVETQVTTEEVSCMYADAPVYWSSSCNVTRSLTLPRVLPVSNLSLNNVVGNLLTSREGSISYPKDFSLDKKVKFKIESAINMNASITMPAGMPDNHYVFVNGNRISNYGVVSISEFLNDGDNEIKASCDIGPLLNTSSANAPISYPSGQKRAEFCSTTGNPKKLDGILLRGNMTWSSTGFAKGANRGINAPKNSGACPSGYYHVGFDDNYDRGWQDASTSAKRCFKQYDEPVCTKLSSNITSIVPPNSASSDPEKAEYLYWYYKLSQKIFNPGPLGAHAFMWPTKAQAKPDNKRLPGFSSSKLYNEVKNYGGRSDADDNGIDSSGSFLYYRIYGDGSARLKGEYLKRIGKHSFKEWDFVSDDVSCIRQRGEWKSAGPCRAPSLRGALGMFSKWENAKMTNLYKGTSSNKKHALLSSSYAMGCGSPTKALQVKFTHVNAIQNVTETPQNCVSGKNQYARALDGSLHYNLQGKAFPYTDSPLAPSTNLWRCLDSDANRIHGGIIPTAATLSYVQSSIDPLYPNELTHPSICYEAEAPKYGVDISGAGFCSDGTFSCWDPTLVSHLPDYLMRDELFAKGSDTPVLDRFLETINPVQNAHAALNGADNLGDAVSVNLCGELEANPSCSYVRQECEFTDSLSGLCRLWDKVYSCNQEKERVVTPAVTRKICETPIPCSSSGDDEYCTYEDETTDSFKDTAVMLSVAQFAKDDSNCLSADVTSCSMFEGEAMECRSYVSAGLGESLPTGNCCSKPSGSPSPVAYVQVLFAISQTSYAKSIATDIAATITSSGVWKDYIVAPAEYVAQLAVEAANETGKWFANQAASFGYQAGTDIVNAEGGKVVGQTLGASISSSVNFLMADISSVMGDILGDWVVEDVLRDEVTGEVLARASDSAFDGLADAALQDAMQDAAQQAAQDAAVEAGADAGTDVAVNTVQSTAIDSGVTQAIGSAFSVVMAVYAAYKITMLVNDMMIACRPKEFETAFKVGTGSCSQVDRDCTKKSDLAGCTEKEDYFCCYNSPLAKIIHEGASDSGQSSNGLGYKTAEGKETFSNDCPGFTFTEFSNLDFDRIDLKPWVDLLVDAGKLPGSSEESIEKFTDIDNVTRSIAKNEKGYDLETTTVPNALGRAEAVMGAGGDAFEEYRHAEREALIMDDQYETLFEDCWYAHGQGESYDGERGYAIFADGTKNYRTGCNKKEGGKVYPHLKESCSSIVEDDGSVITPETTYIIGNFGERVDLSVCVMP